MAFSMKEESEIIKRLFRVPVFRRVLDNGLTLVHQPDFSSEVVSVQVWVKTGSIHEGRLTGSGVSHFLEHLLFKGTARREGRSISQEVHAMGSSMNAYTTFDRTVYYIDGPATAFRKAVDLLADMVLHSTLLESEVERERGVILREIDMGLDDPDQRLSQMLFRTAFQKHPYREPVIGHRDLYERILREDLMEYYRARYLPNNIVVVVAGAVASKECLSVVEKDFASEPRGLLRPVFVEHEPVQLAPRREDMMAAYNIVRGSLAFKVPGLDHRDSPALDALAYALGKGESALLWEHLRNRKNLVHAIDCHNWNPSVSGLFWISYVCHPDKGPEVESAIWSVLQDVSRNGLPEAVVAKARRQSLCAEVNSRKTMNAQACRLGIGEVVVGDINYKHRYLDQLQDVSARDLQEVAIRYLVQQGASSVTLGPKMEKESTEAAPEGKRSLDAFQPFELENGLRLLLQEDHRLPKVHLSCVLLGGPMYEPPEKRGISSLLAELLIKDTVNRKAHEVSDLIESLGGRMIAGVGNNTIHFSIEVLPADVDVAIELLADALVCPAFAEDTFKTELESQIATLKEYDDDILEYGFRKLRDYFFGSHPFAIGPDGCVKDLRNLREIDVREHYNQIIRGENTVISICGDFASDSIQSRINEAIAIRLSNGSFSKSKLPPCDEPKAVNLIEHADREQAVVLQAFPDAGILDDDFTVGEMLNECLSGMSSRLFERVRDDKGLAYYVGATRISGLNNGLFALYAGTHPAQVDEVVQEMNAELARIAAGDVLESELARCRTRLKAARSLARQSMGARSMKAALDWIYGLPLDHDDEYAEKLDLCDARKLAEFVRRCLTPECRVQLVIRPEAT